MILTDLSVLCRSHLLILAKSTSVALPLGKQSFRFVGLVDRSNIVHVSPTRRIQAYGDSDPWLRPEALGRYVALELSGMVYRLLVLEKLAYLSARTPALRLCSRPCQPASKKEGNESSSCSGIREAESHAWCLACLTEWSTC